MEKSGRKEKNLIQKILGHIPLPLIPSALLIWFFPVTVPLQKYNRKTTGSKTIFAHLAQFILFNPDKKNHYRFSCQ